MEPVGEAVQDRVTEGEPQATGEPAATEGSGEPAPELGEGEIADTYETAFNGLEPGDEEIRRVAMDVSVDVADGAEHFEMSVFWDDDRQVAVMTFQNGTQTDDGQQVGSMEGLLVGSVHKTTFVGVPPQLVTHHDENTTWEEDAFNVSEEPSGSEDPMDGLLDPETMMEEIDELPDEAEISYASITYEGDPAHEIHVQHENETEEIDLRVVVDADTERPQLMEGLVTQDSQSEGPFEFEVTFAYGEEADHEHADDLVRLEAMSVESESGSVFGATPANETLTVQPSRNAGSIPLEEVEVHAFASDPETETAEVQMRLPAEEGQRSTEDADLVYEDADGDGHVSPGDEIRLVPRSEEAQAWTVSLYDEETEMRTVPGAGVVAMLASLAVLAAAAHRRR